MPTPEGQYKKAIESLIDEEIFNFNVTNLFNEQLKWERRR